MAGKTQKQLKRIADALDKGNIFDDIMLTDDKGKLSIKAATGDYKSLRDSIYKYVVECDKQLFCARFLISGLPDYITGETFLRWVYDGNPLTIAPDGEDGDTGIFLWTLTGKQDRYGRPDRVVLRNTFGGGPPEPITRKVIRAGGVANGLKNATCIIYEPYTMALGDTYGYTSRDHTVRGLLNTRADLIYYAAKCERQNAFGQLYELPTADDTAEAQLKKIANPYYDIATIVGAGGAKSIIKPLTDGTKAMEMAERIALELRRSLGYPANEFESRRFQSLSSEAETAKSDAHAILDREYIPLKIFFDLSNKIYGTNIRIDYANIF